MFSSSIVDLILQEIVSTITAPDIVYVRRTVIWGVVFCITIFIVMTTLMFARSMSRFLSRKLYRGISFAVAWFKYRYLVTPIPEVEAPTFVDGLLKFGYGEWYIEYIIGGETLRFRVPPHVSFVQSRLNQDAGVVRQPEMALRNSSFHPVKDLPAGIVCLRRDDGSVVGMGFRARTLGCDSYLITATHVLREIRALGGCMISRGDKQLPYVFTSDDVACASPSHDLDFSILRVSPGLWSVLGVKAMSLKTPKMDTAGHIYGLDEMGKLLMSSGMVIPDKLLGRFMHRASTFPGWSGSPIIDPSGFVIGIHLGAFMAHGVNYGVTNVWDLTKESPSGQYSKWQKVLNKDDLKGHTTKSSVYYNLTPDSGHRLKVHVYTQANGKYYIDGEEEVYGDKSWAELHEEDVVDSDDYARFELASRLPSNDYTASIDLKLIPKEDVEKPLDDRLARLESLVDKLVKKEPVFRTGEAPVHSSSSQKPLVTTSSPRKKRSRNRSGKKSVKSQKPQKGSPSSESPTSSHSATPPLKQGSSSDVSKNKDDFRVKQQSGRSQAAPMEQNTYLSAPMPEYAAVVERLVSSLSRRQFRKYAGLIQDPTYRQLAAVCHSKGLSVLNISILSSIIFSGIGSNWTQIRESLAELLTVVREKSLTDLGPLSLRQLLIDSDFCYLEIPGNLPMFPAGSDLRPSGLAVWSTPSESL